MKKVYMCVALTMVMLASLTGCGGEGDGFDMRRNQPPKRTDDNRFPCSRPNVAGCAYPNS